MEKLRRRNDTVPANLKIELEEYRALLAAAGIAAEYDETDAGTLQASVDLPNGASASVWVRADGSVGTNFTRPDGHYFLNNIQGKSATNVADIILGHLLPR